MKRKVIQIAGSTQLISLPRKWALRNNVQKGDELEVIEDDAALTIKLDSMGKPFEKKGELTFTTAQSFVRRHLAMLYKLGYTEVKINFTDPEVIRLVQEMVTELLGFEVITQSQHGCLIKNVAEPLDTEFDTIFRRLFLTVISVAKESHSALQTKNFEVLKHTETLEKTTNKLTFFCERLLNTKGYHDKEKTCFIYHITCKLETVGDFMLKIAETVNAEATTQKNVTIAPEVVKFMGRVVALLEHYHEMFFKQEVDKLAQFRPEHHSIEKEGLNLIATKKGVDAKITHYALDIVESIREMTEFMWPKEDED